MKIPFLFATVFFSVFGLSSLPVIFKTTKKVENLKSYNFVDLISFNSKNNTQIRVGLQKYNLETNAKEQLKGFQVFAIEEGEEFFLEYCEGVSCVVDLPSHEIKIKVAENGIYKVYVWGQ